MTPEQEALVAAHRTYALTIGRKVSRRSAANQWSDDFDSAAVEGLMQAAVSWNGRGSFPGWATWRIRGAVLDEMRRVLHWGPARGQGYQPKPMDLTPGHLDYVDSTGLSPQATETADSGDTGERRVAEIIDLVEVRGWRATGHRRWVAQEVWVNDRTQADVAAELGVTESRVCQILAGVRAELARKLTLGGHVDRGLRPALRGRPMTCQRCGRAENAPGAVQVDILSIRVNGTIEVYKVALCRPCRSVLTSAIARAVEPVGQAAA